MRTYIDLSHAGLILLLALFFHLAIPLLSMAEVYRYTDENGTVHLTDRIENVPGNYREQVRPQESVEPIVSDLLFQTPKEEQPENRHQGDTAPAPNDGESGGLPSVDLQGKLKAMAGGLLTPMLLGLAGTVLTFIFVRIFIRTKLLRFYVGIMIVSCIYLLILNTYLPYLLDQGARITDEVEKTKAIRQFPPELLAPEVQAA